MKVGEVFYNDNALLDERLNPYFDRVELNDGESLIFQGEISTDFYLVESGTLNVIEGIGDNAFRIAILGKNDVFGEMSFFDSSPRSATINSSGKSTVLRMTREQFVKIIEDNPEQGIHLLISMSIMTANRIRATDEMLAGVIGKKEIKDNRELQKLIKEIRKSMMGLQKKWWKH